MAKKKTTNRDKKIDEKIEELKEELKEIVKEKSILNSERVGKKIDAIIDDSFLKELRGNGKPGVFEKLRDNEKELNDIKEFNKELKGNGKPSVTQEVRSLKNNVRCLWAVIVFIIVFSLGGNYRGITVEKIKEKLFGTDKKDVEIKKVEEEKVIEEEIIN